jgi:molybdopterin molybdotransferase
MVEVQDAKRLIQKSVKPLTETTVSLDNALGSVLSQDILSQINMPPIRQSAMDGYAIQITPESESKYEVKSRIQAGDAAIPTLKKGEAARIYTGAQVPDNANAIVMQEFVDLKNDNIELQSEVYEGDHIREIGEQIKVGETALSKGTVLTPAGIGYLRTLGLQEVKVINRPMVSMLVSGNELALPGQSLKGSQVYESNSITLNSVLKSSGHQGANVSFIKDDMSETVATMKRALQNADVLLVTGGISVGDYDFTKAAFEEIGVEEVFYKINQKPGKPLYFGMVQDKLVFGLPGNPASSLICFYEYVLPAIHLLSGRTDAFPTTFELPLQSSFRKKGNRSQFAKAKVANGEVAILEGQQSSMLHTFSLANSIVFVPSEVTELSAGDLVEVHMIQ